MIRSNVSKIILTHVSGLKIFFCPFSLNLSDLVVDPHACQTCQYIERGHLRQIRRNQGKQSEKEASFSYLTAGFGRFQPCYTFILSNTAYLCEVVVFINKLLNNVEMIRVGYVFKSNLESSHFQRLQKCGQVCFVNISVVNTLFLRYCFKTVASFIYTIPHTLEYG